MKSLRLPPLALWDVILNDIHHIELCLVGRVAPARATGLASWQKSFRLTTRVQLSSAREDDPKQVRCLGVSCAIPPTACNFSYEREENIQGRVRLTVPRCLGATPLGNPKLPEGRPKMCRSQGRGTGAA